MNSADGNSLIITAGMPFSAYCVYHFPAPATLSALHSLRGVGPTHLDKQLMYIRNTYQSSDFLSYYDMHKSSFSPTHLHLGMTLYLVQSIKDSNPKTFAKQTNLAKQLEGEVIMLCEEYNIGFSKLTLNNTKLTSYFFEYTLLRTQF